MLSKTDFQAMKDHKAIHYRRMVAEVEEYFDEGNLIVRYEKYGVVKLMDRRNNVVEKFPTVAAYDNWCEI